MCPSGLLSQWGFVLVGFCSVGFCPSGLLSYTPFYQGLHCLLRQNRSSERKKKHFFFINYNLFIQWTILTIVLNLMENSIFLPTKN